MQMKDSKYKIIKRSLILLDKMEIDCIYFGNDFSFFLH